MIAFHAGYLWGRRGLTAFRLVGLGLVASLLFAAGSHEPQGILDWMRFRMPREYVEEGFRLVRFTAGLFAALHAGMNHVPATFRYRAYVAGDGIGKMTFFGSRLLTEGILLTLAYLVFCTAYLAIGFLCSMRFQVDDALLVRIGWGWLFILQAGAYASLLTWTTQSILGILPTLVILALHVESRFVDQIRSTELSIWAHRLMTFEAIRSNGTAQAFEPAYGFVAFVMVVLILTVLVWLGDGETA
jgi:hypothetical protein